ncbi:MAG: hypothetical protein HN982_08080 [Candidatus Marinimicrobia bacterium]|nr:hypothetical protein [Candidatus Woesearchaeota archaeon]MBT6937527.1 hypothetical protein [Candidatus Neomarinimicrobiota bacterium]
MEEQMEMSPEQIKKYYNRVPDPDEKERLCVRIERGPFAGIDVAYGRFQMADKDNDDGTSKVRFEYDIVTIPPEFKNKEFSDEEGDEFESLLGKIYIHVLNKELEKQKEESEDGKTRKYHFAKPTL